MFAHVIKKVFPIENPSDKWRKIQNIMAVMRDRTSGRTSTVVDDKDDRGSWIDVDN